MHLAVALGMLWNTLVLRSGVFSGPPSLPVSPPNPDTRWLSKGRSRLPSPWRMVGEEARLGAGCRAVLKSLLPSHLQIQGVYYS